jgi:hypothetical protein
MMGPPSDPGTGNLLRTLGIDDPAALEDFELLARIASLLTGAPKAAISFADAGRFWPASNPVGPCVSRETAFCSALLVSDKDTLVSVDVRRDPRTTAWVRPA